MSPIAIARNDPQLAHGAARSIHAGQRQDIIRHFGKVIAARNVRSFTAALHDHFQDQIISIKVKRAIGSRAYASAIILTVAGDGYGVAAVVFDARAERRVSIRQARVWIDRHAIARGFQRTLGRSDMAEVIHRLGGHLAYAVMTAGQSVGQAPKTVTIVGQGVALLGTFDGEWLDVGTWLDGGTAADPVIRRLAASEEITVLSSESS